MSERTVFTTLETPRLRIRRFTLKDAGSMAAYRGLPAVARFQNWTRWDVPDAEGLIAGMEDSEPGWPGWWFQVALELKETGELVGDCGLHTLREDRPQGEIGYSLAPAHQGRGLMTEALTALLTYAFADLNMHRMIARVHLENERSQRLLARLGVRREAPFVQSWWFKGAGADECLYALLRSEWR